MNNSRSDLERCTLWIKITFSHDLFGSMLEADMRSHTLQEYCLLVRNESDRPKYKCTEIVASQASPETQNQTVLSNMHDKTQ